MSSAFYQLLSGNLAGNPLEPGISRVRKAGKIGRIILELSPFRHRETRAILGF
jgi:hypothetical protein